jgi:hypothetical protein
MNIPTITTTDKNEIESAKNTGEIQSALIIAKRFPRDEVAAVEKIKNACSRLGLAEQAFYAYGKGGASVEGASIRLVEAVAQYWGNIRSGIVEISRGISDGVKHSECKAFAWDVETNYYEEKIFTVRHIRETIKGSYALRDEREVYEMIANMGSRRKRACILSVIPSDVIETAAEQCRATLHAKADVSPESILKMLAAFEKMGVTKSQIEARIQRKMDAIAPAQLLNLRKIHLSIRDGMSSKDDWFAVVVNVESPESL